MQCKNFFLVVRDVGFFGVSHGGLGFDTLSYFSFKNNKISKRRPRVANSLSSLAIFSQCGLTKSMLFIYTDV